MKDKNKPLGARLICISRLLTNDMRYKFEKMGIVSSYRPFLFHLYNSLDGLTQSELVKLTEFRKPTVSLTLQKMEMDGLIIKSKGELDSRVFKIKLTELGYSLEDKVRKCYYEEDKFLDGLFSEEEKELLEVYLERIETKIKEIRKDENI